jgi:hypothetical protein
MKFSKKNMTERTHPCTILYAQGYQHKGAPSFDAEAARNMRYFIVYVAEIDEKFHVELFILKNYRLSLQIDAYSLCFTLSLHAQNDPTTDW